MQKAVNITVKGRVQGVGFRPFIFALAQRYQVKGTVQNNMDGVFIHIEGDAYAVDQFIHSLPMEAPRLSRIDEIIVTLAQWQAFEHFSIIPSERTGSSSLVIPIDTAVCEDCLREMYDPDDRRYRYPFINCTQCGPRYTIIEQLPYDRPFTSMRSFQMCGRCAKEYEDPMNRRHHAQPIACPTCGPSVALLKQDGQTVQGDAIQQAKQYIRAGAIVAVKGLGGYHLACDATNEQAVQQLRMRKRRPHRPLAIMAASLDIVEQLCHVTAEEKQLFISPEAPIVVVKKRKNTMIAPSVAPGLQTVGVMLPYTPLHHLLLDDRLPVVVMTSANRSGVPMIYEDDQALRDLQGIADYFLVHNRPIVHPIDDSVVQVENGKIHFIRRARGFVPDPLETKYDVHEIVALGGQQKNVFAFGRHHQIFLGPHIGDLEHVEVVEHFQREYEHLRTWMGVTPKTIAVDLHPNYETWNIAKQWNADIVAVQHHHAHMVSCMEENHIHSSCFGLILDGTGYGEDGHIWGFELLYGNASQYKRLGHLTYTPLPGGERCIKEPWRTAVGMLGHYFGEQGYALAEKRFTERAQEIRVLKQMIEKGLHSPLAGTCGRLFDAVSAFLYVCTHSTYDGEAAVRLSEFIDDTKIYKTYPFQIKKQDEWEIDLAEMWQAIWEDVEAHEQVNIIAGRFHETVVQASVELVRLALQQYPTYERNIVLSGGSMHNRYIVKRLRQELSKLGLCVYTHQKVPCNDGGLALGQLIIAAHRRDRVCV
ncbi:carbamoyltransferase HypF [Anoxybacillus ayderensis]|uniref:carbamoyltransferase HypF n=1 Tax=Anoxybacillus sp. ST70 TaxID=2864180 RepID=UPI0003121E33|nr:carbamoyltransferase HypF [Anoxybacillus sp. ST70]AXM90384.1 carbamoyltransferase HypF [Anoxybacillus ayderensis G10]MBW9218322.1 carbamoyltransferase HypF [Anoxybacillus sp. ST70]THD17427.1 carbamoyltransferase HypF [Anoxybacillus ayderensis]